MSENIICPYCGSNDVMQSVEWHTLGVIYCNYCGEEWKNED